MKHLLAIPRRSHTVPLLWDILDHAALFSSVEIFVGEHNQAAIGAAVSHHPKADVKLDDEMTGPLGPAYRSLQAGEERICVGAGDALLCWPWAEFLTFHASHSFPVSALAAPTLGSPGGVEVGVHDGRSGPAVSWRRSSATSPGSLVNIGMYVFDRTEAVLELFRTATSHSEDEILGRAAQQHQLGVYAHQPLSFNINTRETYASALDQLTSCAVCDPKVSSS